MPTTRAQSSAASSRHSVDTNAVELDDLGTSVSVGQSPSTTEVDDVAKASLLADQEAPDGGYGWVVVAGCGTICFWFVGSSYNWGILSARLVADGLASPSTLSFVGSLTVTCIAVLALPGARLIRLLGARNTALLGISLLGGAQIASSFATNNIGALFFTNGVIGGVGTSLCFMVVSVTPAQYFSKRRGLATGIVYAGGGIGGTVMAFMFEGLLQSLGTAWTFRITGLIMLATGLPAAYLIKERTPIRTASFIEWRLFRDPSFLLLFLAGALAVFPLFVPPFFLPLYAGSIGLGTSAGAGLVAAFNFSSAIGRLAAGVMCDRAGAVNTLLLSLLLSALSMLALWPFSTNIYSLGAFCVLNGCGNGAFFSVVPSVIVQIFGSARVGVTMAMIVTGWAAGYLMGAPIAGYLLAAYGGETAGIQAYRPAMFYAAALALASASLVATMRFRTDRRLLKKL